MFNVSSVDGHCFTSPHHSFTSKKLIQKHIDDVVSIFKFIVIDGLFHFEKPFFIVSFIRVNPRPSRRDETYRFVKPKSREITLRTFLFCFEKLSEEGQTSLAGLARQPLKTV